MLFAFFLFITGGLWFILQILNGNFSIIKDFIVYQIRLFRTEDAGHGGFLFYHFVVLFIGVFPASVFALKNIYRFNSKNDMVRWMVILFWVVLILFTIVNTKIVHYSSLCYFPISFLAAKTINDYYGNKRGISGWIKFLVVFLGFVYVILIVAIPFVLQNKTKIIPFIKDEFAVGNLSANVHWSGFEALIALFLILGIFIFIKSSKSKHILKGIYGLFISSLLFIYFILFSLFQKLKDIRNVL
ncbi:MAG: hypothetical protein HC906_10705 [Bacteroidales bacterium]|nr:hypothetical protein [Bacteroidales bacterium]